MEEAYLESQWRGAGIPDGEGLRHLDGKGAWGQGETLAQRPRGRASRAGGQHTSKVELEGLDVDGHDGRLRRVAIQGWQADDDVAEDKESLAGGGGCRQGGALCGGCGVAEDGDGRRTRGSGSGGLKQGREANATKK